MSVSPVPVTLIRSTWLALDPRALLAQVRTWVDLAIRVWVSTSRLGSLLICAPLKTSSALGLVMCTSEVAAYCLGWLAE